MPRDDSSPSPVPGYGRRVVRQLCPVLVILASACSPFRLALPVRGVVVDQATHQPIADATVELTAETQCFAFPEGETRTLQVALTRSGRAGRFTVGGGANVLFPRCIGWETNVAVFAPGYYGSEWNPVSDSVGFGTPWPLHTLVPVTVALKRLRYLRPLVCDYERHAYARTFRHLSVDEDHKLVARLRTFAYTPVGPRGVFVSESGGNFDRLFVAGGMTVTAGSSTTGSVRAWSDDGRPAPVQSGSLASAGLASSRTTREIARLREWIQVSTWRLPAEKALLEDLLQKESDIECVTGTGWKPHPTRFDQLTFVVITRDGADHAVFEVNLDPDRAGHRFFRKRFGPPAELLRAWRGNLRTRTGEALMPLPGPAGKMTACLVGPGGLYVAFAAGGIRRYGASQGEEPLREDGPFWTASRPVTLDADGGPKTFTDLDFGAALRESWCPALYAVTGGPEIYRFGDEGEPDQRIDFQ